uniref:DUF6534 domain-containing protein n=1 Tax=Mycena chlorophos TaxID=658473 RepID=A0ABQ0LQR5_MYCCL|nr:predicted protein [Mycena chlorophos]
MPALTSFTTEAATLDNTLGAIYLGVVASCILFGISTLQVYLYYHFYPNDGFLHKGSVAFIFGCDALHLGLAVASGYRYAVTQFGDQAGLTAIFWQTKLLVAINVVIILVVQSMYAYRVWVLGGYHHSVLKYLVAAVVLGGFVVGIVLAWATYSVDDFADITNISWAIYGCFSASTVIDVMLSVAMCYYLRKSKGSVRALNSRLSTLMQYSLSCGVFTSALSVACMFAFIFMPNNLIFLSLTFVLSRLYTNSFMAMLNARARQRPAGQSFVLSSGSQHHHSPSHTHAGAGLPYVHRTVSVKRDYDLDSAAERKFDSENSSPASYRSRHNWDIVAPPPALGRTVPVDNQSYARAW